MPLENGHRLRAYWLIGATLLSLACYFLLIYQTTRIEFDSILVYFLVLGLIYLLLLKVVNEGLLIWALASAVLLRISLLLAIPELSDDFYRFIWDGRLLNQGISPFAALPSDLMEDSGFNEDPMNQALFQGMNSPHYFTVYPPIAQWIFYLSSLIFPESLIGNLVFMRLLIITFEVGSIILCLEILKKSSLPSKKVLIYAWNPLVIIELTGNLHFEAAMIFFILLAIYLWQINHWKWSAAAMAAGVASKLIPLIFLPLLAFRAPLKRVLIYWVICGLVICLFFASIWSPELIEGMRSSLGLYFQKFEFNASIYYLVREMGFLIKGYNIIQTAGLYLGLISLSLILWLAWFSPNRLTWPQAMVWALAIYLLMSTTVHPWYITPLVAFAVFTDYRFPLAWSILVILSYAGYSESAYTENLWLVGTEYLFLGVALIMDLKKHLS